MSVKTDNRAEKISLIEKQRSEFIEAIPDVSRLIFGFVLFVVCLVFLVEWDGSFLKLFIFLGLPVFGGITLIFNILAWFLPSLHRIRKNRKMLLFGCSFLIIFLGMYMLIVMGHYSHHSHKSFALADIKNAYTAAQAYYTDFPDGEVNINILKENGFRPYENVSLAIQSGFQKTLAMTTSHAKGEKIYSINWAGEITVEYKNR